MTWWPFSGPGRGDGWIFLEGGFITPPKKTGTVLSSSLINSKKTQGFLLGSLTEMRVNNPLPVPRIISPSGNLGYVPQRNGWMLALCMCFFWGEEAWNLFIVAIWMFPKIGVPTKWMVYNGKPYSNGWFGGTTIFENIHISGIGSIFSKDSLLYVIMSKRGWGAC